MKKAKIMLTAIALIAFVSGSFAFKAYHKNTQFNYAYCPTGQNVCVEGSVTGTTITTAVIPLAFLATSKGTLDLNAIGLDCDASVPCTTSILFRTSRGE